jgi:cephalosporin hydroxylase
MSKSASSPSLIGGPQNQALRDAIQRGALGFTYKGVPCWKDPFDLAIYSMLLWREKPRTIIEIGSAHGGSALWLHDMQAAMGLDARVVSIDLYPPRVHEALLTAVRGGALTFLRGDAHRLGDVLADFRHLDIRDHTLVRPLLVIEDSSHEPETTLAVLEFFDQHLEPGEMIIIEDGNVEDLYPGRHKRGGPLAGVRDFMGQDGRGGRYAQAREYTDAFGENVCWNYDGYWRRIA